MKSQGQWASKLLAVKVEVLKKKSATSAIPAEVCASVIGPGVRTPRVKSFSKFEGRQLCSPLTYRLQIFFIKRSILILKALKISRGFQCFKDGFCPLKVTSFQQCVFSSVMIFIFGSCGSWQMFLFFEKERIK